MGSKYTKNMFAVVPRGRKRISDVFRAQRTCLVAAKCLVSVKRDVIIKSNVIVFECTVYYHVVAYYILHDYFYVFTLVRPCLGKANST